MTRDQGFMALDLFKNVIDELVDENPDYKGKHPVWLHHFGESLLHPDFDKFIKYSVSASVFTGLSVNPLMLKEDTAVRLLNAGPDMLYISLDGHDEETFYRIRGVENGYKKSRDNVLRLMDIKYGMESKTRITLSMIDFELNKESIKKTKAYWKNIKGIDEILVKNFTTWDGSSPELKNMAGESHVKHNEDDPVACAFPWERMTVLWDGAVVPCCNDYDKKLVLGHADKQSLSDIWNGGRMRALREEFNSNEVTNPLCRNCDKLRLPRHLWRW